MSYGSVVHYLYIHENKKHRVLQSDRNGWNKQFHAYSFHLGWVVFIYTIRLKLTEVCSD